ncbi:MAG: regulatory protein RecX [Verrucomicrobia bacterium]|nr:regulatory protein RecX [Verrucomicrobiota bacterium]
MKSTKTKAFALLARKGYFSKQLRQKLTEKGYPEDEIEAVIAELTRRGWLNDQELANRYVEQQKQKGYGAKRIALQLREKAGQVEVDLGESEEALRDLIQKRYLSKLAVSRDKVIQALLRRGFSYDLIVRVLQTDE